MFNAKEGFKLSLFEIELENGDGTADLIKALLLEDESVRSL